MADSYLFIVKHAESRYNTCTVQIILVIFAITLTKKKNCNVYVRFYEHWLDVTKVQQPTTKPRNLLTSVRSNRRWTDLNFRHFKFLNDIGYKLQLLNCFKHNRLSIDGDRFLSERHERFLNYTEITKKIRKKKISI